MTTTINSDPVFTSKTVVTRLQAITASSTSVGDAITHNEATSAVEIRNAYSARWPIEYRVGGGAWTALREGKSQSLAINLSTTALAIRRSENAPASLDVQLTLEGIPRGLLAGGDLEDIDLGQAGSTTTFAGLTDKASADIPAINTPLSAALGLKAPLASPTFTGTVTGVTAAMVGLANADNTSDANKPVSTAQATALALKAPLASPTLTGVPAAPTAPLNTNTTQLSTTAFVAAAAALKQPLNARVDIVDQAVSATLTASTTVDVVGVECLAINQTTAGVTITLPSPTTTTLHRAIAVENVGSVAVTVAGADSFALNAGESRAFRWNGTNWKLLVPGLSTAQTAAAQALVLGAGNPAANVGRPVRLYIGDSLTQYSVTLGLPISASGGTGFGSSNWTYLWADWDCESGAGTLTYNAAAKTLQWTPLAGTAGAAVDANKTGFVYVPGGVTNHGVWVVWYGVSTVYTSGTATLTVGAANTQLWQYPSSVQNGYVPWAQAFGGQCMRLAPFPAALPRGMDGCYGLGGATAATIIDAYPQWSTIAAYSTVIQLGTNDFNGAVTVASYVADIKSIVALRIALGDSSVGWLTITPRDTDTTTQRQNKAQAAQLLYDWSLTQNNRFHVIDVAQSVIDPANGASQGKYLSGYSNDGIHLQAGAMTVGKAIADFDRRIAVQGPHMGSVNDTFNATTNPYGSILSAVQAGSNWMEGVGGTISTGAVTVAAWAGTTAYVVGQPVISAGNLYICTTAGTTGATAPIHTAGRALDGTVVWEFSAAGVVTGIATGWTIARQAGSACVAAVCKVARTDGVPGEWQRVILYGATGNEAYRLITAASSTGFAVGGEYAMDVETRLVSATLLNCWGAQIVLDGTSGSKLAQFGVISTSSAYIHADVVADPARSLIMSTPSKWLTTAASTNMRAALHCGTRNTGRCAVDYGRVRLRRVA